MRKIHVLIKDSKGEFEVRCPFDMIDEAIVMNELAGRYGIPEWFKKRKIIDEPPLQKAMMTIINAVCEEKLVSDMIDTVRVRDKDGNEYELKAIEK